MKQAIKVLNSNTENEALVFDYFGTRFIYDEISRNFMTYGVKSGDLVTIDKRLEILEAFVIWLNGWINDKDRTKRKEHPNEVTINLVNKLVTNNVKFMMDHVREKLKPCPLCGSDQIKHKTRVVRADNLLNEEVKCLSCGCGIERAKGIDIRRIWNTRPSN